MASMDFQDTLHAMNITLGDSEDITFTPEEKKRALTKAWNDPWVVEDVWNTAGSFSVNSYQTPLPTGVGTVRGIGVRTSTTDFPQPLDSSYFDIVGSNIQWTQAARGGLTDGTGLYILGTNKLTVNNTLNTEALQEYVIALGAWNTLTLLGYKKANLFLKNDLTMGELVALKRDMKADVENMRARFAKRFQDM